MKRLLLVAVVLVCAQLPVRTQSNGRLQIHYIDVGQGDAAVLISPGGEVVLFDNGVLNQCGKPVAYLQSLGLTKIDYHIASHYHADHVGCTGTILGMFPLQKSAFDRGGSYTTATYANYVNAVGSKRVTAQKGQTITLDATSGNPVTITFRALNGNGVSTTDENDLSLVAHVRFGQFDATFGGDLSGAGGDADPETPAPSCSYAISPTSYSATSSGGSFSVNVTTTAGCSWTAAASASWLSVTSAASGTGSGTVSLSVASNTSSERSTTATIAGRALSVNQAADSSGIPSGSCARPAGAPATATALCRNGTYSFSQNRSGTCSSNGGVQCWLCPGTLCNGLTEALDEHASLPAYADIESTVASSIGPIEVYKVHHHGSRYSTNSSWVTATTPKVGIISVGSSNSYGHPTGEALGRLHNAGTKTYWTSLGNGAAPVGGQDVAAGNVIVEVASGATTFTVRYGTSTDTYSMWALPATPPFGTIDTPGAGAAVAGEVPVTGWALDNTSVSAVRIYRSPVSGEGSNLIFIGDATFVSGSRPDIANAYPTYPQNTRGGWGYMLLSNFLPNGGNGTYTLHAVATDDAGTTASLGTKTMFGANTTSGLPFGTIDTPRQGETVSGEIINWGWALSPGATWIPFDGSTINVFIDGVPVGRLTQYGLPRSDIDALFPNYTNTGKAVGYFRLDTRTLANGVHTIAWSVTNSLGQTQGIGSRFFTVNNQ